MSTYIKIILKNRGMSQMDLIRAMEAKGITGVYRSHLSTALNGNMFPIMARKIEIGLDLPENSLVRMILNIKGKKKFRR